VDQHREPARHRLRADPALLGLDIAVSLRLLRALDDIASTCAEPRVIESLIVRGRRIVAGCAER